MATDTHAARQGLLQFLAKKGGALPMRELHTHSLVFYQAGHQAFSQLMEGLVGDGLVTYDTASAVFTLTDKGRALVGGSEESNQ
jgi:predicted transcriptional regulator